MNHNWKKLGLEICQVQEKERKWEERTTSNLYEEEVKMPPTWG